VCVRVEFLLAPPFHYPHHATAPDGVFDFYFVYPRNRRTGRANRSGGGNTTGYAVLSHGRVVFSTWSKVSPIIPATEEYVFGVLYSIIVFLNVRKWRPGRVRLGVDEGDEILQGRGVKETHKGRVCTDGFLHVNRTMEVPSRRKLYAAGPCVLVRHTHTRARVRKYTHTHTHTDAVGFYV